MGVECEGLSLGGAQGQTCTGQLGVPHHTRPVSSHMSGTAPFRAILILGTEHRAGLASHPYILLVCFQPACGLWAARFPVVLGVTVGNIVAMVYIKGWQ